MLAGYVEIFEIFLNEIYDYIDDGVNNSDILDLKEI